MNKIEIYDKLHAVNEVDILEHFPKRYDDLSLSDLSVLFVNYQKLVIRGKIISLTAVSGGSIIHLKVLADNNNNEINLMIFGQPFYKNILKKNGIYFFFGSYREKSKKIMITQVLSISSPLVMRRYKPYYNLPSNISQSSFYSLIANILTYQTDYITEIIPQKYRDKYKLESRVEAFKHVHFPETKTLINQGLRVFKYEECLKYCLITLSEKIAASKIKKQSFEKIDKMKINNFISKLNFKLTPDQINAVREIILDMDSALIMNRLLEGDVGMGKTIVAFIAIYANYLRGGQSCLLVPTLTLAAQHYEKAKKLFSDYNLNIALLDNSLKASELRKVQQEIEEGKIDVIIGTHSVFSDKVKYNNLSLVVIDEQHKFGVLQRDKIIDKGKAVDHLMMSATPIPQTMSKIINSDLDVTSLTQYPFEERKVVTRVVNSSSDLIVNSIHRALAINKQVFIVAPKIEKTEESSKLSTETIYEEMVKTFGNENVNLLTGRTKKEDKEKIYTSFLNKEKKILVSTSIIEVGIDVKDACLMIVYEANYFGLASLHQLRGRIGRSGEGALALLVYDGEEEEAIDKLNYIASHSKGEDIALYDLEHRGSGTLGTEKQSGESSLQVANFVRDFTLFEYARKDVEEILNSLSDSDIKAYYDLIMSEKK